MSDGLKTWIANYPPSRNSELGCLLPFVLVSYIIMQSKLDSIDEKMSIYCPISVCSKDLEAGLLTTIIPVPN